MQYDTCQGTKPAFGGFNSPDATLLILERPDSAASRVLAIAELLEHILSYLSAQDLITTSNINSIFNACIRRSPKAQVKLFLRPSGEPQQIWYESTYRDWGYGIVGFTVYRLRNLARTKSMWDGG